MDIFTTHTITHKYIHIYQLSAQVTSSKLELELTIKLKIRRKHEEKLIKIQYYTKIGDSKQLWGEIKRIKNT